MKPLTPDQLSAIQSLISHPNIETLRLEFFKKLTYIYIKSTVGAEFSLVNTALWKLREVFPSHEYRGKPCSYLNPVDGKQTELYTLDWDGETLISLSMVMDPEHVKLTLEEVMQNEG